MSIQKLIVFSLYILASSAHPFFHRRASNGTSEIPRLLRTLSGHNESIETLAIGYNSTKFISGSNDNSIRLWDISTGDFITSFSGHESNSASNVNSVGIANDKIVGAYEDGTIKTWNATTGDYIQTFSGYYWFANSVGISGDGKLIVSSSNYLMEIRLWDGVSGALIRKFTDSDTSKVADVAISSDGKRYAAAFAREVKIWNSNNGQEFREYSDAHTDFISAISFSYDGRYLLSCSYDRTAKLWDAINGKLVRVYTGHTGIIRDCAISQDGSRIVTGAADAIKLWDTVSGQEIFTFNSSARAVVISSNGQLVASSLNTTVYIWDSKFDFVPSSTTTTVTSTSTKKTEVEPTKTSTAKKTEVEPTKTSTTKKTELEPTKTSTTKKTEVEPTKTSTTKKTEVEPTKTSTTKKTEVEPTKTSTTKRSTTTTARCTGTPLVVNNFSQLNPNLLGGKTETNGTGNYFVGGGIGAWAPKSDGTLSTTLYPSTSTTQCRSISPYSSLQFLLLRADSKTQTTVTVGVQTGCGSTETKILTIVSVKNEPQMYKVPLTGVDLTAVKKVVFKWTGTGSPTFFLDNIAFACNN
ncbi:hypothetical protein HK098_007745 [Nowakowskiella sp. JEL0407]|nr:hypothetical protein HK098_007745 [Nowakowskiella sp. JEL0407]